MTEVSFPIRQYVKRENTIPAVKWDGSLEMVPFIASWLREYDVNISVMAEFWETAVTLKIVTRGSSLRVTSSDYITANASGVIQSIDGETFDRLYREEEYTSGGEASPEPEAPEEAVVEPTPEPEAPEEEPKALSNAEIYRRTKNQLSVG